MMSSGSSCLTVGAAADGFTTTRPAPCPQTGRLAGKTALVTGGNSGIGLATAEAFVREGARVMITGRAAGTLASAASTLQAAAVARGRDASDIVSIQADVSRLTELDRVMERAQRTLDHLDVLFVNAGIASFAALDQATEDEFDTIFDVNVKGAYFTVQKALPLLTPGASVIFNASINASIGMPKASIYSASKAAVRSLARTLSADLTDQGVRVNAISPGPVTTPILERIGLPRDVLDATRAGIRAQVPIGRFGEPGEIAAAAVFLASDESRFFVGAELVADGGMSQL